MSLRVMRFSKAIVSFANAYNLGKTLVSSHEPEDLPISVDCFKFSRKDAKVLFIDFFLGGMLCQRVGTR